MDEKPVHFFGSRRIGKYSNYLEVKVEEKTFANTAEKEVRAEVCLLQ